MHKRKSKEDYSIIFVIIFVIINLIIGKTSNYIAIFLMIGLLIILFVLASLSKDKTKQKYNSETELNSKEYLLKRVLEERVINETPEKRYHEPEWAGKLVVILFTAIVVLFNLFLIYKVVSVFFLIFPIKICCYYFSLSFFSLFSK